MMPPVVWRCWLVYQVAALPLAIFCCYASLFWLGSLGFHVVERTPGLEERLALPEIAGGIGLAAFGAVHWFGLRVVPRMRAAWVALVAPLPWLGTFLGLQFDDDLSFPGDSLLPPSVQGTPVMVYLALLLGILGAALLGWLGEAWSTARVQR